MSDLTSQTINRPLFELLEGDVCRRWGSIEVEPVGVLLFLVGWVGELLLAMVEASAPLRIYAIEVLSEHFVICCPVAFGKGVWCMDGI
jgi:hypothetical protein